MKFRFCGDQDCPDWFLTQMATLSRLSSVKAKLLAQHVGRHLSGQQSIDMDKMDALLADLKLQEKEVRSLLASVEFVLSSASRFQTNADTLRAELQQVGLPKEHAAALARVQHDTGSAVRQRLISNSFTVNKLEDINCSLVKAGADGSNGGLIRIELHIRNSRNEDRKLDSVSLTADPAKLQTLLYELEKIKELMAQNGLAN